MVFAVAEPRRPMPALCPGSAFLAAGSMLSRHRFPPHAFCPVVPFHLFCVAGMGTPTPHCSEIWMVNAHIQCHILRKPTWTIDYQVKVDFKSNVLFPVASKGRKFACLCFNSISSC